MRDLQHMLPECGVSDAEATDLQLVYKYQYRQMQGLANNGVNTRELQRRINRRGTEVLVQIDLTADQDDAAVTASDESSSSQLGKFSASAPEPAASNVMTKSGDLKDPLRHDVNSGFHAKGRGDPTTWQENVKIYMFLARRESVRNRDPGLEHAAGVNDWTGRWQWHAELTSESCKCKLRHDSRGDGCRRRTVHHVPSADVRTQRRSRWTWW